MSARVTETEARAAYIAMEGRRSATGVRQKFMKEGRKVPSLRTFGKWRAKFKWRRLAAEHDAKVSAGAADQIVKDATEKVVTRASQFDTLATESLKKAIAGLTEIDVKGLKGIVKVTVCRLISAFLHEANLLKLRRAAIDNLPRFRSVSG